MFQKIAKHLGLIGDSFEASVEKELQSPLAQLYFNLLPASLNTKHEFLDKMDRYIQLSLLNPHPTDDTKIELEMNEETLSLDIFHILNKRPYTEGDTLVFAKQALREYTALSNAKKTLFRESLLPISHKGKSFSPVSKQKIRV